MQNLKQQFNECQNVRKRIGNLEIKLNVLTRQNKEYYNLMINDFERNISIRKHIETGNCSFDDALTTFAKLVNMVEDEIVDNTLLSTETLFNLIV